MEQIIGLEKHKNLKALLEKAEKQITEQEADDAGLNMRKCVEYITQQYVREYPNMVGENLFATINNLKDGRHITTDTAAILHKIRIFGNEGGAHYTENGGKLQEAAQYYQLLLSYIPVFLKDFPEPSSKELVKFSASGMDYSQITDIEIETEDFVESSQADYFTTQNYLKRDATVTQLDKLANKLVVYQYDYIRRIKYDRELTYVRNGRRYLNRKVLVKRYEEELNNANEYDPIAIPGIIQEYLGSHQFAEESGSLADLLNGTAYTEPTSLYRYVPDELTVAEVLWEYAAFSGPTFHIPECITCMGANFDYIPPWRAKVQRYYSALAGDYKYVKVMTPYHHIKTIILHDNLELEDGFNWRIIFPNLREVRGAHRQLLQTFPATKEPKLYYFLESFTELKKVEEAEKAEKVRREREAMRLAAQKRNQELAEKRQEEERQAKLKRRNTILVIVALLCLSPVLIPIMKFFVSIAPWLILAGLVGLGAYKLYQKKFPKK